ncbi:hypothetical protein J2Z30_009593 [Streptomyces iranensis]|uniref:Uncharacterized protein n=1 Tax=Streptomyces iranensis TaxID=576784 RepID=A0ABS4N934_9ACTN|nr:hypothetical protein [Streptomyces iranensis]
MNIHESSVSERRARGLTAPSWRPCGPTALTAVPEEKNVTACGPAVSKKHPTP